MSLTGLYGQDENITEVGYTPCSRLYDKIFKDNLLSDIILVHMYWTIQFYITILSAVHMVLHIGITPFHNVNQNSSHSISQVA